MSFPKQFRVHTLGPTYYVGPPSDDGIRELNANGVAHKVVLYGVSKDGDMRGLQSGLSEDMRLVYRVEDEGLVTKKQMACTPPIIRWEVAGE